MTNLCESYAALRQEVDALYRAGLEVEQARGREAATALVAHLHRMAAAEVTIPVQFGKEWYVVQGRMRRRALSDEREVLARMFGKPWDTGCVWVCEAHPWKVWPHDDCPGPGMPPVNVVALQSERDKLREALQRYKDGPWLVIPGGETFTKQGEERKRFAAFEDNGGDIARETLR